MPRGFVYDYIVDCAHRGPAFLDWDWAVTGDYLSLRIQMTSRPVRPGPHRCRDDRAAPTHYPHQLVGLDEQAAAARSRLRLSRRNAFSSRRTPSAAISG